MRYCSLMVGCVVVGLSASVGRGTVIPVPVSFSGGSGSPLTVTLSKPIQYTVTTASADEVALFVIQNTGNVLGAGAFLGSGTISYSINGGPANSIDSDFTFAVGGVVTANDLSLFKNSTPVTLNVGDVVLLSAGSETTNANISAPAPSATSFPTILTNADGTALGSGVAVPEPASVGVLAIAGAGLLLRRRTQKN